MSVICISRWNEYPSVFKTYMFLVNYLFYTKSFIFTYHRLSDILEIAEDMEIDIPHIWQYLAELIVHMLHDGGIPIAELFR